MAQIITYGTLSAKTVITEVLKCANVPLSMIIATKNTIPTEPSITISDVENDEKFLHELQGCSFQDTQVKVNKSNVMKILEFGLYIRNNPSIDIPNTKVLMSVMNGIQPEGFINIKSTWTWEKALNIIKSLEGLNKNESTHAAGVVISPVQLESNVPLMRKDGDGVLACQYDMKSLEAIGYLKMDSLGLRTVDVNHSAGNLIRKWYDKDFTLLGIPLNDQQTIKSINDGDTTGIFQIESSGFTQMMQQLDIGGFAVPRSENHQYTRSGEIIDFMWIAAGIALYRPGPLDAIVDGKTMVQHLIDRKTGKEPVVYLFSEEKDYLEETYGVLVYQEQVMARVRQMTGCTLGRADILRKAMGRHYCPCKTV